MVNIVETLSPVNRSEKGFRAKMSVAIVPFHFGYPFGEAAYFVRRKKDGLWTAIGGHVEAGEGLEQAALREMREEVPFCETALGPLRFHRILEIVGRSITSFGALYFTKIVNDELARAIGENGFALGGDEVDMFRPFSRTTISLLFEPGKLYKPGFNEKVVKLAAKWMIPF